MEAVPDAWVPIPIPLPSRGILVAVPTGFHVQYPDTRAQDGEIAILLVQVKRILTGSSTDVVHPMASVTHVWI